MDALTNAVRSQRARPVAFELPDGTRVEIDPPTLGQAAACVRLDPRPDTTETAAERVLRFARQARILLGAEHAGLVDQLQQFQIAEIIGALYVAASGLDPADFVRWQQQQRKAGQVVSALQLLESIESLIIDLAARLGRMPTETEGMPLADAVALRNRMDALEKARTNLQATIAGVKLDWHY